MKIRLPRALSPYHSALGSEHFRRLMAGYAVSALGDGAGYVAVAWLATQLAPPDQAGYSVALALAAYVLPGSAAGLALGRHTWRLDPRHLIALDAIFRFAGLALIAALFLSGRLDIVAYVGLLAGSSLFHAFGSGGVVTLVSIHVPVAHRFAANSLVEALTQLSITVLGPGIGGVLVAVLGATAVLITDAASFLVLLGVVLTMPKASIPAPFGESGQSSRGGLHSLLRRPSLAWLLALSVVFYGLYGPVETALPLLVRHDLRQGPQLLGTIWAANGAGALVGALVAGSHTIRNLRRFALAVVAGWGIALLLVASTTIALVITVAFAVGGCIYAPYPAAATTLLQQELKGNDLSAGAVAWNSVASGIVPIGILLGGPLVATIGARGTMGVSAIATIALATLVTFRWRGGNSQGLDAVR